MELKHHFNVPTPLADTWHSFNQLEEIAPCFPGAVLTSVDGDAFTGTVKIKLGPIAMMYSGTGRFISREEATHTVVIEAQGKDKRGNGTAGATVTAVLGASAEGTTVDVSTEMNITGKPAQFGRGVIQDISDKLLAQFVQCVINKAAQPEPEEYEPPEPAEPEEPEEYEAPEPAEPEEPVEPAEPDEPPEPEGHEVHEPQEPAPAPKPAARHLPPAGPVAELDLGSALWPALAKRFVPAALVIAGAVILAACLRRCKRKRKRCHCQ